MRVRGTSTPLHMLFLGPQVPFPILPAPQLAKAYLSFRPTSNATTSCPGRVESPFPVLAWHLPTLLPMPLS